MSTVTIYTRPFCGFCARALNLLREKGVTVEEIDAGFDPEIRKEMRERSDGRNTFPQIFIGGEHVGGCDDLFALERSGRLDARLKETA